MLIRHNATRLTSASSLLALGLLGFGCSTSPSDGTPDLGSPDLGTPFPYDVGPDIDLASFTAMECVDDSYGGHVDVMPAFSLPQGVDTLVVAGMRNCEGIQSFEYGTLCASGPSSCVTPTWSPFGPGHPPCGLGVITYVGDTATPRYGAALTELLGTLDTPLEAYTVATSNSIVRCGFAPPAYRPGPDGSFEFLLLHQLDCPYLAREVIRVMPDGTTTLVSRRDTGHRGCP